MQSDMSERDDAGRPYPWLAQYPRGVPSAVAVPDGGVDGLFASAAAKYPDRPFLNFRGRRTTYGEAAGRIGRAAAGLRRLDVGACSRVGLCLPNLPDGVLSYFAVLTAGATVVNLDPLAAEPQLVRQITDSGSEVIVTVDLQPIFGRVLAALNQTSVRHVVVCRIARMLPFPQGLAFRLREHARLARLPRDPRVLDFTRLTDAAAAGPARSAGPRAGVAVIQYTGGTTGHPKGAMLSHANLCANVMQLRAWFTRADPGAERFLAVLPFFHCFGMTAVMNFAVALGGELVIEPRFRPAETLRAIERYGVTMLVGVPALFRALLECPTIGRTDFSSLKVCVSGGDVLPESLARRFVAQTGVRLAEGYGLTECAPVVTCSNPLEGVERPGSCGLPLPGTEVAILATEPPARALPAGEIGEICVRGPQVMRGYWQQPDATRETLRDGWLHTGDLGRLDEDGHLYFVSRRPEVIAVRGYKVYARIVEDAIRLHPAVAEVAVVAMPDPVRGEVPKAYLVLKDGATLDAAALHAFLADRVSPVEMPRDFVFRSSLPKSSFGKILKHALADAPPPGAQPASGTQRQP